MQKVLGVKLFKARHFEEIICLISTQLKQNRNKINSTKFVENIYICDQFYLNELVLYSFVFKVISYRKFKLKKCLKFDCQAT